MAGALSAAPAAAASAPDGAAVYAAKCAACHRLDANGRGPAHRGLFGRAAGLAPGYAYSPALKASGLLWDAATLDRWLQGPQKLVPGSRMFFMLPDAAERQAVIAYLRTAGK